MFSMYTTRFCVSNEQQIKNWYLLGCKQIYCTPCNLVWTYHYTQIHIMNILYIYTYIILRYIIMFRIDCHRFSLWPIHRIDRVIIIIDMTYTVVDNDSHSLVSPICRSNWFVFYFLFASSSSSSAHCGCWQEQNKNMWTLRVRVVCRLT